MSSYKSNKFDGNIGYGVVGPAEFEEIDFEEITDEIEKSLIEIKNALDIPDSEIEDAIQSRRFFRMKHVKHANRS